MSFSLQIFLLHFTLCLNRRKWREIEERIFLDLDSKRRKGIRTKNYFNFLVETNVSNNRKIWKENSLFFLHFPFKNLIQTRPQLNEVFPSKCEGKLPPKSFPFVSVPSLFAIQMKNIASLHFSPLAFLSFSHIQIMSR